MTIVFLTALMPVARAVEPTVDQSRFGSADRSILDAIEKHYIPGAVLVAGTADEIVYRKAYGSRALDPEKLPMREDTIFDLASLSKNVGCATSLVVLVDRGKID